MYKDPLSKTYISFDELIEVIPYKKTQIKALMEQGEFPLAIRFHANGRRLYWHTSEVKEWLNTRPRVAA